MQRFDFSRLFAPSREEQQDEVPFYDKESSFLFQDMSERNSGISDFLMHNRPIERDHHLSNAFSGDDRLSLPYQFPESITSLSEMQKVSNEELLPISVIPEQFRTLFPYSFFNYVQTSVFEDVYRGNENLVIEAPTGSGKTVILELAILQILQTHKIITKASGESDTSSSKVVVYIAPTKALCQEKTADWTKKFGRFGFKVTEMTGDSLYFDMEEIQRTNILITTPEKFDSFTRKFKDHRRFLEKIGLLLLDEIHILNEERGATVEAVVSRLKMLFNLSVHNKEETSIQQKTENDKDSTSVESNAFSSKSFISTSLSQQTNRIRFIAVSATMPNIDDVAEWLLVKPSNAKRFSPEHRPIQLEKVVLSYPSKKNPFMFDRFLDFKLLDVIQAHNDGLQTLVFCPTRKSASLSASQLARQASERSVSPFIRNLNQQRKLDEAAVMLNDKTLSESVRLGIGFHSAGLSFNDRKIVETLFVEDALGVLCTTTTLAQGVNLPAHLVVIKSTQGYRNGGGAEEYTEHSMTQMMGRAGRPQFDTSGRVVIMTADETRYLYEDKDEKEDKPMESHLKERMIEHLNAEIVLETIRYKEDILRWIKSTFFFIRLMKNPTHYCSRGQSAKISASGTMSLSDAENFAGNVVSLEMERLKAEGFIEATEEQTREGRRERVAAKSNGISMAKYYIAFDTMCLFKEISPFSDIKEILNVLSKAKEFCEVRIRLGDKMKLNSMNKHVNIRYPIKGKVKLNETKVNLLIQAHVGRVPIDDFAMKQDALSIVVSLKRILLCLADFLLEKAGYQAARSVILLKKCVERKMWETAATISSSSSSSSSSRNSSQPQPPQSSPPPPSLLEQLEGIGPVFASQLRGAGIHTFAQLLSVPPQLLETILRRNSHFVSNLRKKAASIPQYSLDVTQQSTSNPRVVIVKIIADRIHHGVATSKAESSTSLFLSSLSDDANYLSDRYEMDDGMFSSDDNSSTSHSSSSSSSLSMLRLLVGDSRNELCFTQRFVSRAPKEHFEVSFAFERTPRQQHINVSLINENYVGVDSELRYNVVFPLALGKKKSSDIADETVSSFQNTPSASHKPKRPKRNKLEHEDFNDKDDDEREYDAEIAEKWAEQEEMKEKQLHSQNHNAMQNFDENESSLIEVDYDDDMLDESPVAHATYFKGKPMNFSSNDKHNDYNYEDDVIAYSDSVSHQIRQNDSNLHLQNKSSFHQSRNDDLQYSGDVKTISSYHPFGLSSPSKRLLSGFLSTSPSPSLSSKRLRDQEPQQIEKNLSYESEMANVDKSSEYAPDEFDEYDELSAIHEAASKSDTKSASFLTNPSNSSVDYSTLSNISFNSRKRRDLPFGLHSFLPSKKPLQNSDSLSLSFSSNFINADQSHPTSFVTQTPTNLYKLQTSSNEKSSGSLNKISISSTEDKSGSSGFSKKISQKPNGLLMKITSEMIMANEKLSEE
ncbi:putative ATP-dependent DNA helicase MER3 [Monocercomonoides exilis]|uniref:putative ATP-dependent DNA helicase MER3 n=1 Tax=Monocercomonoides exilis TaxID=2049356 RepID=UPI00355A7545|nr:putative ATP-dependent DNA helicase MER3 [Monocercomonoides exilis]|eukprot:MONOS_11463.1-p1 / transcript=MONOS_11463.1 / gene=MONOS_11463 / organism=Monocercomonoides_exilis_PA203 / gene_product=ATP-dependent DNA helicase MER3 homolog / transcript_product=ATP-dependent DNA helicase MER3 homolog / location=Mono_scaffold00577:24260-28652(+) / protein_length=1449 / sequence_SO=supercontig / SO=protein_coding / is_pseudo=false